MTDTTLTPAAIDATAASDAPANETTAANVPPLAATTPSRFVPAAYGGTLEAIEMEIRAALCAHGIATAQDTAVAIMDRLCYQFGGVTVYWSKARHELRARDAAIREVFNGRNIAVLARDFDLSERRVRQIVGPRRPRKKVK